MKLQDIVKEYRKQNHLSLRAMALKCGCSHQYLSYLEKGYEGNHSIEKLKGLAQGMNMDFDSLLDMLDDDFMIGLEKGWEDSQLVEIDKYLAKFNSEQKDELIRTMKLMCIRDGIEI